MTLPHSRAFDEDVGMWWKESGVVESRVEAVVARRRGELGSVLCREHWVIRLQPSLWVICGPWESPA